MRRVAYLAMAESDDVASDCESSFAAMRRRGFEPVVQPWREPGVDWDAFVAVYPSTPWDYPRHLAEFRALIDTIDRSSAVLINPAALVRWNLEKTYLKDLERNGVRVVPTLWFDRFDARALPDWFAQHGAGAVVIKPVVGANADHVFVIEASRAAAFIFELETVFAARPFCVQPFVDRIRTDGEYSLFFFGTEYSHAVRKVPATGDFRTQEQFGARVVPYTARSEMIAAGREIVARLNPQPVYARVDLVRDSEEHCLLMELELIEPSLYFRTEPRAADRFARAFDTFVREHSRA